MSVEAETAGPRTRRWFVYAPLSVFLALAWLLFERLGAGDPASIPSALLGQPAPALNLPGLDGAAGLTDADLRATEVEPAARAWFCRQIFSMSRLSSLPFLASW